MKTFTMKSFTAVAFVLAFPVASALVGCSQETTAPGDHVSVTNTQAAHGDPLVKPTYASLSGRWKFVYDDARKASVEAELAGKISDPAKLAEAKKEAQEEADASEIEFTADRVYVSRIGQEELLREGFTDRLAADGQSLLLTPTSLLHRLRGDIAIVFFDANTIVMKDPRKGDLVFRRATK
jgi:hypothetical protein